MVTSERMVTKRDGRREPFDATRIKDAITKAIIAVESNSMMDLNNRSKLMLRADAKAERFTKEVLSEIGKRCNGDPSIHIEKIQDMTIDVLHRDFGRGEKSISSEPESLWMAYMLYRQGRSLVRSGLLSEDDFREKSIPYSRIIETRGWNKVHGCGSIRELNEWFSGKLPIMDLIRAAEKKSDDQLYEVADTFRNAIQDGRLRAIIISGPSASGKTVSTRKAVRLLQEQCPEVSFKALEADNYFRGHDVHEKVHYNVDGMLVQDINYELPESYDISLINEHLDSLMKGNAIFPPKYDFSSGIRSWSDRPMALGKDEVLLIDCMHALSPQLTQAIPKINKFMLYIEALSMMDDSQGRMIPWTDIRLLRRMLRDVRTRGHPIPATLWHWKLIRLGERFLLPYVFTADAVIDGGVPYELPVLKHLLKTHLQELQPMFERNPDLYDGRERLRRIMRVFDELAEATPYQISQIPATSVLREFIGGSEFF